MTITEAIDCLDDYCNGLETLLQKREGAGNINQQRHKKTEDIIEKVEKATN